MPDHILTMQPITKERVWDLRGGLEEEEGKRWGEKKENREGGVGREEDSEGAYLGMVALRKLLQRGQTGVSYLRNLHVLKNLQNRTRRTHSSCITL